MHSRGLFQAVAVHSILYSKNVLRNPHPSLEELIVSIMQRGLIQPITVRPKDNDQYELIAGHRRFEACKGLGMQKIMCHIIDVDDKEAYEISITENVQQKTMSPIEEATAFKRYTETFGWGGVSDLAHKIGKSQEYVSKRIKLLSLPDSVQQDVIKGKISVSMAEELLSIANKEIANNLGKCLIQSKLSTKQARHVIKAIRKDFKNQDVSVDLINHKMEKFLLSKRIDIDDNCRPYNTKDDQLESSLFSIIDACLKKSALSIRLSLGNIDEAIEDVEDHMENYNLHDHPFVSRNLWIAKEILMQNRIKLHEQIDQLLRQISKLRKEVNSNKARKA